jgi:cystathionine beta-lyase/cystathionine gamma-synthase
MTVKERDILIGISGQIGNLEGKIDGVLKEQARVAETAQALSDRVSRLEVTTGRFIGYASGVAAMVALVVSLLRDALLGKIAG